MSLPNFFCIGAQKSGTTLLHDLLSDISDIYLPRKKEIHFFDLDSNYNKGLDWYLNTYFKNTEKKVSVGEITPSYIFIDGVAERIFESLGENIKFIVILRNPIDRAYSQYIMKYKTKEEKKSFEEALTLEELRTKHNLQSTKKFAYTKRGFYAKQIENYLNFFKKEQFLFIKFEDFIGDQDNCISEICDFLGVKKDVKIVNKTIHASKLSIVEKAKFSILNKNYNILNIISKSNYPDMSLKTRKKLKDLFRDDIIKLEKIIDKDLSQWLE